MADLPKKYIRTFEGDMETYKKGWTPNLAPLKKPPVAAELPVTTPTLSPIQTQIPRPKPEPAQVPKQEPHRPSPLQTYAGDFSQRMKETHASTATVLAAEQDAKSGATQGDLVKPSRRNILYIVAGAILLLLGVAGSYIAYSRYLIKTEPIVIAPTAFAPIFVDERERISGETPSAIRQAIEKSTARSLAPNAVRLLYTDSAMTADKSVFSALQLPAPGVLLRNVNAAKSMAGIANVGGEQNLFFILSVASYSDTFAGMLSWEPTMPRDLSEFFPLNTSQGEVSGEHSASQSVLASTSPRVATSTPPAKPVFRDEIVNNHDARIYRDAENRSVIIYGYWNQATLIIARNPSVFAEILERLATSRAQP